jgi:hypothetical protein
VLHPPSLPVGERGERGVRHDHQDPAGDPRGGEDAPGHLQGSVPDPNPDPPDVFLGLPDPDPLFRGMDPDPSITEQI